VTPQIVERPPEPRLEGAIAPLLERLTRLPPGPHWIVSCYVRLEPGDRTGSRYLLALKERIKTLENHPRVMTLSREDRLAVERAGGAGGTVPTARMLQEGANGTTMAGWPRSGTGTMP
jgi:hypothetical protein